MAAVKEEDVPCRELGKDTKIYFFALVAHSPVAYRVYLGARFWVE